MSPKSKRVEEVSMLETGRMGGYREPGKTKTKKERFRRRGLASGLSFGSSAHKK